VGVLQGVAGEDGVGAGLVVLGAGLVHVGDRGQAHFQALVGVVELALAGGLVGLGGGQGLDRHQYVEVGGGGAHHQVVAGGGQVLVGGGAERALGAQGGEVAPVEQRQIGRASCRERVKRSGGRRG